MSIDLGNLFKQALKDERKVLRPYFFPADQLTSIAFTAEETYLRLRLARMFLKHRREYFQTKYPVVNSYTRLAGLENRLTYNIVVQPQISGNNEQKQLVDVVSLDQTLLGPILYRGGDLEIILGLYAAPADDWAKRFIKLAEGISMLTLNATVTTAVAMAGTVTNVLADTLGGDGLDLKLGLNIELHQNKWLTPGYLVMIAAPDEQIDQTALRVENGELLTASNQIYNAHDYIVIEIESMAQRSDWQSLGYGRLWQTLLNRAAEADNIQIVKDAYTTFSSAILASEDLSWPDRRAIIELTQQRVKAIRDARAGADFLDGIKGFESLLAVEALVAEETVLASSPDTHVTPSEMLATDWIE